MTHARIHKPIGARLQKEGAGFLLSTLLDGLATTPKQLRGICGTGFRFYPDPIKSLKKPKRCPVGSL